MSISPIGGGSFPTQNATVTEATSDVQTAQAAYDNLQQTIQLQITQASVVNSDITNLLALVQENATAAQINAARQTLYNDYGELSTIPITNPVAQGTTAAANLVNAQSELFNAYMSQSGTTINGSQGDLFGTGSTPDLLSYFNGVLSTTDYNNLQTAITNYNNSTSPLIDALNAFNSNQYALSIAQLSLSTDTVNQTYNMAVALLSDSNQNTWASVVAAQQNSSAALIQQDQGNVSSYSTTSTSLLASVNAALLNYNNALTAPSTATPPGILTILESYPTAQSYIAAITASQTSINTAAQAALTASSTADATAQAAYLLANPSNDPNIAAIQAAANATLQQTLASIATVSQTTTDSDFPSLPQPGQTMSMADLMRYISGAQVLTKEIAQSAIQGDSFSLTHRLAVLSAALSAANSVFSEEVAYANKIYAADVAYDNQVETANSVIYSSQQAALNAVVNGSFSSTVNNGGGFGFGNGNLPNSFNVLNNVIQEINQQNSELNNQSSSVSTELNSILPGLIATLNNSDAYNPTTINDLDIGSSTPDATLPTPLPVPSTGDMTTQYPVFPYLSTDSGYPTNPTYINQGAPIVVPTMVPTTNDSQSQIDTYNAQITALNDLLGPLASQISQYTSPPFTFTPIPLLYYNQEVPIRSLYSLFDTSGLESEIASINQVLKAITQQILANFKVSDSASLALQRFITPGSVYNSAAAPAGSNAISGQGAGLSIMGSQIDVNAGTTGNQLHQVLYKSQFLALIQDILGEASLKAAIKTVAASSTAVPNTNRKLGLLGDEEPTNTVTVGADGKPISGSPAAIAQGLQDTQLNSIVTELLNVVQNPALLHTNAQLIVAGTPDLQSLSATDLNTLISATVITQQLTLLLLAAVATVAVGNPTPEDAVKALSSLFNDIAISFGIPVAAQTAATPLTAQPPSTTLTSNAPAPTTTPPPSVPAGPNVAVAIPPSTPAPAPATTTTSTTQPAPATPIPRQISFADVLNGTVGPNFTAAESAALRADINSDLAAADIPGQLSASQSLQAGLQSVLTQAPSALIASLSAELGVSLNGLPSDVSSSIIAQVSAGFPSLSFLSPTDKASLAVAAATGAISQPQLSQVLQALVAISVEGATFASISQLAAAIKIPAESSDPELNPALPTAKETRDTALAKQAATQAALHPESASDNVAAVTRVRTDIATDRPEGSAALTVPNTNLKQFHDTLAKFGATKTDQIAIATALQSFADSTENLTNFYKVSISKILDPANFYIKNFSILTAEKSKGGQYPTSTNSIPV